MFQVGFSLHDYIEMQGQHNLKFNSVTVDTASQNEYYWDQHTHTDRTCVVFLWQAALLTGFRKQVTGHTKQIESTTQRRIFNNKKKCEML